jgi:hypothetical protein
VSGAIPSRRNPVVAISRSISIVLGFHTTIVSTALKKVNARLAETTCVHAGEPDAPNSSKLSSPAGSRVKSAAMSNFDSIADSRS